MLDAFSYLTWLAYDIISYSGMMFSRVLLLHHELRDYSLGQIAFAVFQALLAIISKLCWHNQLVPTYHSFPNFPKIFQILTYYSFIILLGQ